MENRGKSLWLKLIKEVRIFYGWWIVLCALVMQLIATGITIYTFGVFLKPLVKEITAMVLASVVITLVRHHTNIGYKEG